MASYLLKASDSDMKRWKDEAARCRVPFGEWLRRAADAAALDMALSTSREPVVHAPPVVLGGKRSYGRLVQLIARSQRFRRRLRTLLARLGSPIPDANAGEAARTDSPQPGDEPPAPP